MTDERALQLFRSGELSWVYCHLMSLGNMGRMVDRIAQRAGGQAAVEAQTEEKADAAKRKTKTKVKKS